MRSGASEGGLNKRTLYERLDLKASRGAGMRELEAEREVRRRLTSTGGGE
jgi:hypothetical protein